MSEAPALSVVLVVGRQRRRAARVIDALYGQTLASAMELVIVDVAPADEPALATTGAMPTTYLRYAEKTSPRARAEALSQVSAPLVALIPDHCYPSPEWAQRLVDAHREPWAAVTYGFTNANPGSYMARAVFLSDYALWARPVPRGPTRGYPGDYAVYRRDVLDRFRRLVDQGVAADLLLAETLIRDGCAVLIEPAAVVAHENFAYLTGQLRAAHAAGRLLATNRVRAQRWSWTRRVAYGLAAPVVVPPLRVIRLFRSLRGRRPLWWPVAQALPVILVVYTAAALGESLGYLLGLGGADVDFDRWDLSADRFASR